MTIRLAVPTGDAKPAVTELLRRRGIRAAVYDEGTRLLRSHEAEQDLAVRVFREKDVPVQVALGNYDLGICGDVWISEQQVRFPGQLVTRVGSLPGPQTEVWVCCSPAAGVSRLPDGPALSGARIASEFPNLADAFATRHRIPGYALLPLWGSADAYPPEDADLVIMAAAGADEIRGKGLVPLARVFAGGLALIANRKALGRVALSDLLRRFADEVGPARPGTAAPRGEAGLTLVRGQRRTDVVRLALPDGHAQRHTYACLREAGLAFDGYEEKTYVRRPVTHVDGLEVKVVRPQDMPQLVAMGAFDAAVTGVDWLTDHKSRFPQSPVAMAVDLRRSWYKIGPVVDQAFPAETTDEAVRIWNSLGRPVRIASEYPALAEKFARDHHLFYASIIPINGASEGFVPEDADILIEGSETGTSIRANGLKMLDPFMESTNCLIVRTDPVTTRLAVLDDLVERLRAGVAATA